MQRSAAGSGSGSGYGGGTGGGGGFGSNADPNTTTTGNGKNGGHRGSADFTNETGTPAAADESTSVNADGEKRFADFACVLCVGFLGRPDKKRRQEEEELTKTPFPSLRSVVSHNITIWTARLDIFGVGRASLASLSSFGPLVQRKRKRFCDKARPSCALCVARGIPCLYLADGEPDPSELEEILKKAGKKNACERCKAGKKACDGSNPCGRCVARNLDCVFVGKATGDVSVLLPGKRGGGGKGKKAAAAAAATATMATRMAEDGDELIMAPRTPAPAKPAAKTRKPRAASKTQNQTQDSLSSVSPKPTRGATKRKRDAQEEMDDSADLLARVFPGASPTSTYQMSPQLQQQFSGYGYPQDNSQQQYPGWGYQPQSFPQQQHSPSDLYAPYARSNPPIPSDPYALQPMPDSSLMGYDPRQGLQLRVQPYQPDSWRPLAYQSHEPSPLQDGRYDSFLPGFAENVRDALYTYRNSMGDLGAPQQAINNTDQPEQQQQQQQQQQQPNQQYNQPPFNNNNNGIQTLGQLSLGDLGALERWNSLQAAGGGSTTSGNESTNGSAHPDNTYNTMAVELAKSPLSISELLWDSSKPQTPTSYSHNNDNTVPQLLLNSFLNSQPLPEPERQPGSWWPPVPTPPFVVTRPVIRGMQEVLPPDDVLRSLIKEFFEDYHPTFPVLHRQTFLNNYRSLPHLLFSVCLLSTGFSSDPFVLANRSGIEVSLFLRCARELRACIDRLPEYHLDETTLADASDTGCPETCLALAFVALWAYRRGYASLHQSVIQLALRLARRYGLAVDPGESSTFGMRTPRDAWVRRELRRKAWASIWTLSEFVKSITGKEIDDLAAEGRRHRIPPNDHQWEIDSEDPGWIPPLFEAPGEFRPRIMELVDWMDKPATDPLRQPGIEFSVGALERRSLVVIYLFGFLRLRTNQFLDSCKAVGISPVELQGLEAADEEEEGGEIEFSPKLGLESPQPSQVFETLPPETKIKVLRGLKRKADRIEGNIKDILANLPPRLRKAEAEGDAAAMIDFFQPEVASVPFADKSLFARVLYLSQIRLFKLEARTSYGVLGFQDMGKLAAEWHMGTLFQDCLESAIVYTRCLASLLRFHPSLSYISITTGLFPLKIGAFHLAVLQFYRQHAQSTPAMEATLFADVERDLYTCLQFLEVVAANHSSAEWWASRIVDTLRQMANTVLRPQIEDSSPGQLPLPGSSRSSLQSLHRADSGPTQVEVNQVYLRSDAPDAPVALEEVVTQQDVDDD